MSLVQCVGCHHKSFLFCCYQQSAPLYTLCQACVLEASFKEQCLSCHDTLSRVILDKKQTLDRERRVTSQLKERNSHGQIQRGMQLLNLNHPQGHFHQELHQSRQSGGHEDFYQQGNHNPSQFRKKGRTERMEGNAHGQLDNSGNYATEVNRQNQNPKENHTDIFSGRSLRFEEPRHANESWKEGFGGPATEFTAEDVRLLNEIAEAPMNHHGRLVEERNKSGLERGSFQVDYLQSQASERSVSVSSESQW